MRIKLDLNGESVSMGQYLSIGRGSSERLGRCVTERLRGANFQRSDQCCVYLSTQTTRHALGAIRSLFGVTGYTVRQTLVAPITQGSACPLLYTAGTVQGVCYAAFKGRVQRVCRATVSNYRMKTFPNIRVLFKVKFKIEPYIISRLYF